MVAKIFATIAKISHSKIFAMFAKFSLCEIAKFFFLINKIKNKIKIFFERDNFFFNFF